jgi:hypothetical protein
MNESTDVSDVDTADAPAPVPSPAAGSAGLSVTDFRMLPTEQLPVSSGVIGAAAWYRDALYVGIEAAELRDCGIWRLGAGGWSCVYRVPGEAGDGAGQRWSFVTARVLRSASDTGPVLYFGLGGTSAPCRLLRSEDGQGFVECDQPGFGLYHQPVTSPCAPVAMGGRVFSSPAAAGTPAAPALDTRLRYVLETGDPLHGGWIAVSEPAFGDDSNLGVSALAVFAGRLYAATLNRRRGFQLWCCQPGEGVPYRWRRVLEQGAWRPINSVVTAMTVFGDALYLCCAAAPDPGGRDRYGPFPAEIIRVYADDRWELVAGQPRFTPHGYRKPVSGRLGGLDDYFTRAFTACECLGDWLYCAGESVRHATEYLNGRDELSSARREWLREETAGRLGGEFSLWRTRDGADWECVTDRGFPDGDTFAVRVSSMVSGPRGLFVFPARGRESAATRHGVPQIWLGTMPGEGEVPS